MCAKVFTSSSYPARRKLDEKNQLSKPAGKLILDEKRMCAKP